MINTTPRGAGSRLLGLDPDDAVLRRFATRVGGVHHLAAGEFDESGIAVSCFGAKRGAVELYLNHPLDGPGKHVVVDMTAGADAFASALLSRFALATAPPIIGAPSSSAAVTPTRGRTRPLGPIS